MSFDIDPREYYGLLAEVKQLNTRMEKGDISITELQESLKNLEVRADRNDLEHLNFTKFGTDIAGIHEELKKMSKGTLIYNQQAAKDNGVSWPMQILKNPQYMMWIILLLIILVMIISGYQWSEISQVLGRIR